MAHHSTDAEPRLPAEPIDQIIAPFERFMHVSSAGGVVLFVCIVIAMVLANSPWSDVYVGFWKTKLTLGIGDLQISHSLKHWINDGLMAVFFFVVGLEVKRELVIGELRETRKAALPIAGALGGMIVPALIYLSLQHGQPGARGWGIPMATDIAFVVGCMGLLSDRVPHGLRVMLLSLAIVDDIGAILVIAIGYSSDLDTGALWAGLAGIGLIAVLGRLGVRSFLVYTIAGAGVWLAFHESGIHATIAGVILGLQTPATRRMDPGLFQRILSGANEVFHGGSWEAMTDRAAQVRIFRRETRELVSPLEYLENVLHPWSSFLIMPIFALANAGVVVDVSSVGHPVTVAVAAGLALGKPLGILLFSFAAVALGLANLPKGVSWLAVLGGGALAGIGFTMALFIAELALDESLMNAGKMGVLGGSVTAAFVGMILLRLVLPRPPNEAPG